MLKEAIDRLLELASPDRMDLDDGRTYVSRPLHEVKAPVPEPVKVRSLTAFRTLEQLSSTACVLHVVDHIRASAVSQAADVWGRRPVLMAAEAPSLERPFRFGQYYELEEFIIQLLTSFVASDSRAELLRLISEVTGEQSATASDDGITQHLTVRRAGGLKERQAAKPIWNLRPYRTFLEIDQPESAFLLRVKTSTESPPSCALFEADGGRWKLDAQQAIASYLSQQYPALTVVV